MHKVYIATAMTVFSFSFVYAEVMVPQATNRITPVSVTAKSKMPVTTGTVTVQGSQVQLSRPAMMPLTENGGQTMFPTTGDIEVDSKLRTLLEERNKKIKAIHEEYDVKIKALLKDRKASTKTQVMEAQLAPVSTSGPIQNMVVDARARLQMTDDGETVSGSYNGAPEISTNPASGGRYPMQAPVAKAVPKPAFPIEKSGTSDYQSPFRGLFNGVR